MTSHYGIRSLGHAPVLAACSARLRVAMSRIADLVVRRLDVPLVEPFGIATGAQLVAHNVLVELVLEDGTRGLGEAAPFPAVNGETQAAVLAALPEARAALLGLDAARPRRVAAAAREALRNTPSALAAVETALLDAFTRRLKLSLWAFFGGAEPELSTDITIPTGDADHAAAAAERAARQGFDILKVKIGGAPLDADRARLSAIGRAAPAARLVLDANASHTARETLSLLDSLGGLRSRVVLLEQPTPRGDLDALREVNERAGIPVAADESARSAADVVALARAGAAAVINVKITKSGVFEAWEMIHVARASGLSVMVGGMVETELCMTLSACLAAGLGGFSFVDLDTPLFMAARPLTGGFEQAGPRLRLDGIASGHGVRLSGGAESLLSW